MWRVCFSHQLSVWLSNKARAVNKGATATSAAPPAAAAVAAGGGTCAAAPCRLLLWCVFGRDSLCNSGKLDEACQTAAACRSMNAMHAVGGACCAEHWWQDGWACPDRVPEGVVDVGCGVLGRHRGQAKELVGPPPLRRTQGRRTKEISTSLNARNRSAALLSTRLLSPKKTKVHLQKGSGLGPREFSRRLQWDPAMQPGGGGRE